MITLRDYQEKAISDIRSRFVEGKRRVLFVLPTGGGKTTCFCWIAKESSQRGRVIVLVHRDELVQQVSNTLKDVDVPHGIVARGSRARDAYNVQVCSVHTVVRRQAWLKEYNPSLVIVDEAHHAVAGTWKKVLEAIPRAYVLGVTATPERLDGTGLGEMFDCMVEGPTLKDLTEHGSLAPAMIYAPDTGADFSGMKKRFGDYKKEDLEKAMTGSGVVGCAVEHYRRLAMGKRLIVFCVSIRHATMIRDRYKQAGIPAEMVDGTMGDRERKHIIDGFRTGRILILVSVDLISEGFDVPACDGAQLLRKTDSLGLYLQQVGRALRPAKGKREALILDHVGNWQRHGHPEDLREWKLSGREKKSADKEKAPPYWTCKKCYAVLPAGLGKCPRCGGEKPATARDEVKEVVGELKEVRRYTDEEIREMSKNVVTLKEWHAFARQVGRGSGWAFNMYQMKKGWYARRA
jgi:superfamily II DNA or RNA helicase